MKIIRCSHQAIPLLVGTLLLFAIAVSGGPQWLWQKIFIPQPAAADSVSVSGTIYSNEGSLSIDCSGGNYRTIAISVNGGVPVTGTCSAANGTFTVSGVSISATGDTITVFSKNHDAIADSAVTVTRAANASSSLTGIDLYANHVIVRHEDSGPLSNIDLAKYDSNSDASIPFTMTGVNLRVHFVIDLYVWPGTTYIVGGEFEMGSMAPGNLHLAHDSSMTITNTSYPGAYLYVDNAATLTINADIINATNLITSGTGTIATTSGTPTVQFSEGTLGGGSATLTFYNLQIPNNAWILGSNIIVKNNLTLPDHTQGSLNANGKTITLTGTSVTFDSQGYTLANVTIDPPSTGTVTLSNHDLTVSGTLSVGTNGTLSVGTGRTIFSTSTGTVTINGTISGAGTLTVMNSNLGTSGTLSAITYFDAGAGNLNVPGRVYGAAVTVAGQNPYTATFGTASGQTFNITGNLTFLCSGGVLAFTVDASINNPTVNATGNFLATSGVGGPVNINMGSGAWTMGGDFYLFMTGTFNHNNGTLVMNGTGTLSSNGKTLNNFTTSGAGAITLANATHTLAGNLNIGSAGLTAGTSTIIMNGTDKTIDGGGKTLNSLTISGTETLQNSDLTVGTLLTVDNSKQLTINSGRSLTLSKNSGTTLTLNGTITGTGRLTYQNSATTMTTSGTLSSVVRFDMLNGAMNIPYRASGYGGSIEVYNGTGNNRTATLSGSGTYTIAGGLYLTADGNGNTTIDDNGNDVTIIGDLDFTGSGNGTEIIQTNSFTTWTVSGNVDFTGGTYTTSLLNSLHLIGTNNQTFNGNGQDVYWLKINPPTPATVSLVGGDVNTTGMLEVATGDTFSIDSNRTATARYLMLDGTISGAGRLKYTDSDAFPNTGTISAILLMDATDRDQILSARTYGGPVELYSHSGSARAVTLASGTLIFSSTVTTSADNGGLLTVDLNTNDPTVTVSGLLTIGATTTFSASSANPLNLARGLTRIGTFSANNGTVNLTTSADATITGDITFYNFAISGIGAAKTITLTGNSTQTVNGTWTVTGASGQLVILQSSDTNQWNINPASASVVYADLNYSNNQGVSICAAYSQSTNNTNTNWQLSHGAACIAPTIVDAQSDDPTPHRVSGGVYNIDFHEGSAGALLDYAQYAAYSAAGLGGSQIVNWTNIFTADISDYTTDWPVELTGLAEGINFVSVRVLDIDGRSNQINDVFTIYKDTVTPILSSISTSESAFSITISWTTSEAATSKVQFGKTTSYSSETSEDSTLTTTHAVILNNLQPQTSYHFQLIGRDLAGNTGQTSEQIATTTTAPAWYNRAIGPTLLTPILQDGFNPTFIVRGVAKGNQTIRLYLNGHLTATVHTTGSSQATRSFFAKIPLRNYPDGRYTVTAQSTDSRQRTSIIGRHQTLKFTLGTTSFHRTLRPGMSSEYTVKGGDSLWRIAQVFLGAGGRYGEIVSANLNHYPSLQTNPYVILSGWILIIP